MTVPTYSDDGHWWWDGRTWPPVTQQPPYGGQPQAHPQYGPPQPPYPQQQYAPQAGNGDPVVKRDEIQVLNYSYPTALPKPVVDRTPNTLALTLPEGWEAQ